MVAGLEVDSLAVVRSCNHLQSIVHCRGESLDCSEHIACSLVGPAGRVEVDLATVVHDVLLDHQVVVVFEEAFS